MRPAGWCFTLPGLSDTPLHVMPKYSCSASFRRTLYEDPDLKHVGMTSFHEAEILPPAGHCSGEDLGINGRVYKGDHNLWIPAACIKKPCHNRQGLVKSLLSDFYRGARGIFLVILAINPPDRFFSSTFLSGSSLCCLLTHICCAIEKRLNMK